jgi:hypothetical protein
MRLLSLSVADGSCQAFAIGHAERAGAGVDDHGH